MGYINGKGYAGSFADYNKHHYGIGSGPALSSLRGYTGYPQGYAEYDSNCGQELSTREVASIAERNSSVKPAGLQGLDTRDVARLAQRDYSQLPAGLQPASALAGLSISETARLAEKGSLLGSLEQNSAFDGLGDDDSSNWSSNFNSATKALTETGVISALAAAVKSVPDNASIELKQQYYRLAMEMLKRRRSTDLRHLDIKRVELESNLGWLVNSTLPKTGGFDKAIGMAMGTVGAELAKNEKDYYKNQKLEALGKQLKKSVEKMRTFEGLSDVVSDNKYLVLGGLAVVAGLWYLKGKKKLKFKRR